MIRLNNIRKFFTKARFSKLTRLYFLVKSLISLPSVIQLEHTTKCNLKCKYCMRSNGINTDMPISLFNSICAQLRPKNRRETRSLFLTGLGEPFLNPNLFFMIKYAKRLGFEVGLTSNLTIMNQSIARKLLFTELDHLHISIDYADKELFESIRIGAKFEHVLNNLKIIVGNKKQLGLDKPKIMLNAVVSNSSDVNQLTQMIDLAKTLKVDGVALTAQIYPHEINESYDKLVSLIEKSYADGLEIKPLSSSKICEALTSVYVTFDGRVLPCSTLPQLIPREEYWRLQFGCLKNETFNKIWFSKKYKLFRIKSASGASLPICKYCPEIALY